LGEFDGTGRPGLLLLVNDELELRRGFRADGTFEDTWRYTACEVLNAMGVGDVDGDGIDDIVIHCDGALRVILGRDDGDPEVSATVALPQGDEDVQELWVADLNGDGAADVVYKVRSTVRGAIVMNDGSGAFTSAVAPITYSPELVFMAFGDVNGDGDVDLLTAHYNPGSVEVRLGNGDGTFAAPVSSPIAAPQTLSTMDWDGRGRDVVSVGSNDFEVSSSVYAADDDGVLTFERQFSSGGLQAALLHDMNGDGFGDLVVGSGPGIRVYLSTLPAELSCFIATSSTLGAYAIRVGDLDGDGNPDIVLWDFNRAEVGVHMGWSPVDELVD